MRENAQSSEEAFTKYTVTGISLDRFATEFSKENRSRLTPVTVHTTEFRVSVSYHMSFHNTVWKMTVQTCLNDPKSAMLRASHG